MRLALALCLLPLAAAAQDARILSDRISAFETGVICPPPSVGERIAPGTVAGVTHIIEEEPPFVSASHRVPAVLGIGFGTKAQSADAFGIDAVTVTVTHPPMGPEGVTTQSFETFIRGDSPSLSFYQFDYDYELLVGDWTMQAAKDGEVFYSASFRVVPPAMVPELASVCGYEDLLS